MGIWVSIVTQKEIWSQIIGKEIPLTFQMEQNRTFLGNFKYDY